MGRLRIHNSLAEAHPDVFKAIFIWLRKECRAQFGYVGVVPYEDTMLFHVEGEGIPEGPKSFCVLIKELVPNVLLVQIET